MKLVRTITQTSMLLLTLGAFVGCETGTKYNSADTNTQKVESGIIAKSGITEHKPYTPKASEITKIFSKTGTPGYYIQVGYFKSKKPNTEFVSRMRNAQLPYKILEKYTNGTPYYHALVGPYKSYNQANAIKVSAKEFVSSKAFIVNVVRP